jgi:3-oxoacyl-[acyl-carrier protein] reductase
MEQRVVLVTGAGGGLGRAICVAFARAGYNVVVNYAHAEDDARATADAVTACGVRAHVVQADVAQDEAVRRMMNEAVTEFGALNVLVNNAGTTQYAPLADLDAITDDTWDRLLDVNLKGPFHCARAAAPYLREHHGSIINIASNSAFRPTGSSIPYMASKAGLVMLTRCLAEALGPDVRTNAVAPGWLDTPWVEKYMPPERRASLFAEGSAPPADVDDVARAVVFLAETQSINGQTLVIDRGQLMR